MFSKSKIKMFIDYYENVVTASFNTFNASDFVIQHHTFNAAAIGTY